MISDKRLEELARGSPCAHEWCFYKELISHMENERDIIQARLIMELRYFRSRDKGTNLGKDAELEFVKEYARKYADVYDNNDGENLTYDEIFERVFGFKKVYLENPILSP